MGACGCVYVSDCDHAEVYEVSMRTACKPHQCVECWCAIRLGEQYERVWARWGGTRSTRKTCTDCLSIRDTFFCEGHLFGSMFEDLYTHIGEMNGQIASSCITSLTPAARAWVCDMIEEVWDELELELDRDDDEED